MTLIVTPLLLGSPAFPLLVKAASGVPMVATALPQTTALALLNGAGMIVKLVSSVCAEGPPPSHHHDHAFLPSFLPSFL